MNPMSGEKGLPACECFTVLDSRAHSTGQCDVCDQSESRHATQGRRVLSGGEIEELRRRMLIERYMAKASDEASQDAEA
jgi:hypothetical protein